MSKPGVVACVCNHSILEVQARALDVQSYSQLCSQLEISLVTVDCLKKRNWTKTTTKSSMFLLVIRSKQRWGACVRGNLSWFYYQFKRTTDIKNIQQRPLGNKPQWEMAQWAKVLTTKLDDLTLITRTHGGWREQTLVSHPLNTRRNKKKCCLCLQDYI